jgi:hypothetical protein
MNLDLDRCISKVKACEYLAEDELKQLCDFVRPAALHPPCALPSTCLELRTKLAYFSTDTSSWLSRFQKAQHRRQQPTSSAFNPPAAFYMFL